MQKRSWPVVANQKKLDMAQPMVVITRPEKQARTFSEGLKAIGRMPVFFPLFEIEALCDYVQLDTMLARLAHFEMVFFVSPNAIDAVFERLAYLGLQWPKQLAIGVMGVASRHALSLHGIDPEETKITSPQNTERTDSETLLEELNIELLREKSVLIVRGDAGRDFLSTKLGEHGVLVEHISAYQRRVPILDEVRKNCLNDLIKQNCDWILTSSEALKTLMRWSLQLASTDAVVNLQHQQLFVPHFRIAQIAKELGFQCVTLTASGDEKLLLALQSQNDRTN
jgi:uroporphyrinogen-III synthase